MISFHYSDTGTQTRVSCVRKCDYHLHYTGWSGVDTLHINTINYVS